MPNRVTLHLVNEAGRPLRLRIKDDAPEEFEVDPPLLELSADKEARLANQERLRELRPRHGHEVRIFSAHDPVEYDELAGS